MPRHNRTRTRWRPQPGIYVLDRDIYRLRHTQYGDGWYAHKAVWNGQGSIEWSYVGQINTREAVRLHVDPEFPFTCTRCPKSASGTHAIGRDFLCTECMSDHMKAQDRTRLALVN